MPFGRQKRRKQPVADTCSWPAAAENVARAFRLRRSTRKPEACDTLGGFTLHSRDIMKKVHDTL